MVAKFIFSLTLQYKYSKIKLLFWVNKEKNMAKKIDIIGLDELELTNNEMFVRKSVNDMSVNSRVIVPETHNAIIIKDGQMLETLSAGSYPLFDKREGMFKNEKIGAFSVELIFVSTSAKLQVLWGTRNLMDIRDPLTGLSLQMGASGEFEVRVSNPRKFYKELVGADKCFSIDSLKQRLQGKIISVIEPAIAKTMRERNLSYCDIAEHKIALAEGVLPVMQEMFDSEYGLEMVSFFISRILVPDECKQKIDEAIANGTVNPLKQNVEKVCSKCKKIFYGDENYCSNCGTKL